MYLTRDPRDKIKKPKPGKKVDANVPAAAAWRGDRVAYKIPLENMWTAIYYGSSHNRHDLYEYDEATGIISLTGLKVTPEHSSHVKVAEYNFGTRKFTALVWDDVARSLKQTVTQFLINIMVVFDVEEIEGPMGFMRKWDNRMEIIKKMRNYQTWKANDHE